MTAQMVASWAEQNQRYLMREVHALRGRLEAHGGGRPENPPPSTREDVTLSPPPALEYACEAFGLSSFEREVLLLCAGSELDSRLADLIRQSQNPARAAPTFGLALASLAGAHWSALAPSSALRYWRLLEVGAGETLASSPLRIDERILHYLAGVSALDDRLSGLLDVVEAPVESSLSVLAQANAIVRALTENTPADAGTRPLLIQLCGEDLNGRRAVAATACARLGVSLYSLAAGNVPQQAAERDAFVRLWQREAALDRCALLLEEREAPSPEANGHELAIASLLERIQGVVFVGDRVTGRGQRGACLTLDVGKPSRVEQESIWLQSLGDSASKLNGSLDVIRSHFDLDTASIQTACAQALRLETKDCDLDAKLWEACRAQARSKVDGLAQRSKSKASWADLVLPEAQLKVLQQIVVHVQQRHKVHEQWGFAQKGSRGLGISALFAGPSGTGKTLAAEVLANELKLDLYRVDLSRMVSKYIGETEKNLSRVFDAAERGSGILLFDEADALFGKRSEVKESHDRYANVEVSYLLQRMEAYGGLAILTTNMQGALDPAFLRRLRFAVQFPFPDAVQRAEIWRRVFPRDTPVGSLDYAALARLQVSGGNIYSIALNAAFFAAQAQQPVGMPELLQAARGELAKLDRSFNEADFGARP